VSSQQYNIANKTEERPKTGKILGVLWDGDYDVFTFKNQIELQAKLVCKRTVLQFTASIFDPLGFLSPYVIKFKILFQCLCVDHKGWDEPLVGEKLAKWNSLISELHLLSNIHIPRCYYRLEQSPVKVQIHGFCDASELAYAAVVYVRCDYGANCVETTLVTAKIRVAPLKRQTIPRLELLGALILARLMECVVSHVKSAMEIYCWTDSMTVLQWIKNREIYRQYVQSRIDEIHQKTEGYCWQHYPGSINPADLPSRGISAQQLVNSSLWWKDPEFLMLPQSTWPGTHVDALGTEVRAEIVKHPPIITHSMLSLEVEGLTLFRISEVVETKRYSSYNFLMRLSAYVMRFVNRVRSSVRNQSQLTLTADEICTVETMWIRSIQYDSFSEVICYLKGLRRQKPLLVDQFDLYFDEKLVVR